MQLQQSVADSSICISASSVITMLDMFLVRNSCKERVLVDRSEGDC